MRDLVYRFYPDGRIEIEEFKSVDELPIGTLEWDADFDMYFQVVKAQDEEGNTYRALEFDKEIELINSIKAKVLLLKD